MTQVEEEWLQSHPHSVVNGLRVFPNGAHVLTQEDICKFAALGRPGLEPMEGQVLGVSPEAYAWYKYDSYQDEGMDTLDQLIDLISGTSLPEEEPPLQQW